MLRETGLLPLPSQPGNWDPKLTAACVPYVHALAEHAFLSARGAHLASSPLLTKQDTALTSKRLRVDSGNLDKEGGERGGKRRGGREEKDKGEEGERREG